MGLKLHALALSTELAHAENRSLVDARGVPGTTLVLAADTTPSAWPGRSERELG